MPDIGYYTLPVIPSLRGTERRFGGELNRTFGKAGTDAGTALSKAASQKIKDDKSIERAVETKAKAADKLTLAMSRTRAAQASLTQAESQGNIAARAKQVEAVAQARTREAAAIRSVASATSGLDSAVKTAKANAENAAKGGGGGGGGAGMMGLMLLGRGGVSAITSMSSAAGTAAGMALKGGIAGVVTVGAAAAILAPFIAGFKLFNWAAEVGLPLERTMNEFRGVTGASKSDMAAMGNQARMLGSDIHLAGTTATDAAKAMTELAKSGFTTQQSIEASRATVQLATAGQIEAAQAAEIVGTAINTFGLKASDAQTVVDDFAATVMGSAADIPDLALSLQMGGAAAHGFGISMQDTLATLGTFAQMGIKSSDAGTLMKTSLLAWQNASDPQVAAMEKLNLHLSDAQGNFVGYRNMLEQLAVASRSMTQAEFNEAAATVYGSDAFRAAMLAKGEAIPTFDRIRGELDKEGQAARMAGAQMDGLPGIVEGVSNTMDGLKLSVYDAGNSIAVAFGREGLNVFGGFANWLQTHQPQMVGFFTGLGVAAVEGMAQMMSAVETGADALGDILNVIGDTMGGVVKALATVDRLIHGTTENNRQMFATAETLFGLGDGLHEISRTAGAAEDRLTQFQGKLQTAGDQANDAAKATRDLGGAMAQANEIDTVLHEPTPEQLAKIDAAKFKIEAIPGTKDFKVIANTDEANTELNALREQQGAKPIEPPVKPNIAVGNAAMQGFFDKWQKEIIAPPVNPIPPATNPLAAFAPGGDNGPVTPENLSGLTPGAIALSARYAANFGLQTISGWRPKTRSWDEHQTGKAIDIGIPNYGSPAGIARGDAVLRDALSMPQVKHVIWRQTIYTQGGGSHGMEDRGDATQNHFDHVHILLKRLGGKIPGTGFGDKVPVLAEPDEHMFTRGDVAAMGGHAAVYDFRRALHRQGGGAVFPWDEVAKYESGGNWANNDTGHNGHYGGLQFAPGTWLAFGGGEFAPMPNQASREQQITVADRTAFTGYKGNAPQGLGAWEVIVKGMVPNVTTSTPRGAAPGTGAGGATPSTGGTPGIDPTTGASGTYVVDPEKVAAAEKRVRDADADVAIQEQQVKELKADAAESQKMAQNDQVRKAKEDAQLARDELAKAKQGEFKEGKAADTTTGTGTGGESQLGDIGSIASAFLKDTFGFGDLLPDPSQMGIVKLLGAIMGIKYTPQGTNFKGGVLEGMGAPPAFAGMGGGGGDPISAAMSAVFGMTGNVPGFVDPTQPGGIPPPPPEGVHPGTGAPPGPVQPNQDNSVNVTVNGYSKDEVVNGVRRELQWAPRVDTYAPPGG